MDFILIGILLVVVGLAVFYVVRAKKKGVKCIGCPNAGKCASCKGACGSSSGKPDK
jgi:hypothetical protein